MHKVNRETAMSCLIKIKRDRSESVIARLFIEKRVYNEHFWNCCHPFIEIVDDFMTRGVDGICKHLTPPFKGVELAESKHKEKKLFVKLRALSTWRLISRQRVGLAHDSSEDGSLSNAIMM